MEIKIISPTDILTEVLVGIAATYGMHVRLLQPPSEGEYLKETWCMSHFKQQQHKSKTLYATHTEIKVFLREFSALRWNSGF